MKKYRVNFKFKSGKELSIDTNSDVEKEETVMVNDTECIITAEGAVINFNRIEDMNVELVR